ncbi:TPA: hypothetical protein ACH3X2_008019 [Trebouxia sp. C0005]
MPLANADAVATIEVDGANVTIDNTVCATAAWRGFANDVFDAAYNITTHADSALVIFDDLVVILNVDVNVSGMNSDVACVGTWLNGMADPTIIADGLESLDTYLSGTTSTSGTFDPAREAVITDLASYGASGTGEYIYITGAYMGYITNAATFLQSTSTSAPGYNLQVTNFENAATTLTTSYSTYSTPLSTAQQTAIDDVGSTLTTLTDGIGTLATKLADVDNIYNSLQILQQLQYDAINADESSSSNPTIKTLVADLGTLMSTAWELYWHQLPFLITDLTSQATGYTTTQPCMDTLLYQIEHINQTVIALPAAMSKSYVLLDNLDLAVEALMTGADTNPQTLATDLTAFHDSLATSSTINDTISALNNIISDLQLQTDTYFSSLATEVNSLATATSNASKSPNSLMYSNTFGTDNVVCTRFEQALNSLVSAMTTTEDALPARDPYIVAEAAEGVAYHQLPTPKGAVLLSITSTVADLNSKITTTTTTVRADIASYDAQILDKIVTLHNETVDKVTAKEDQYLPKVRHYDSYRMTAEYVYFSVVIFVALMLILIVIINFQWAASFFTFLLLLAMLIYGIIGTVFLLLAMVGHDECSNAETQIFTLLDKLKIGSASFNATILASYYILGEGGSVNAIAESATGVNFTSIENTINNTIQETVTGITGSYTLRYKLQDEVDDIQDLGQTLSADVNAVHSLVEFQNVHPIYLGAKQLVCCDVVDLVGNLWLSMFMAGWFSVVLAVAMCCGCAFRSYKEFLDPEDKRLAAIQNKGKYMPAGREGSTPGTPGALSVNAIKVGASGSLAGGLITGVSNLSATSTDSARLLKAGMPEFNSDGTPRASMTPRASSYMVPPESPRVERSTDSQNRQSLLGVQSMSVEASSGSLLSPGTSKKGAARKSFTTKSEQKKAELKNMMRMNQLE